MPAATFVLDVSFDDRTDAKWAGARWDPARRRWVYRGPTLPPALARFLPPPHSPAAFDADEESGGWVPRPRTPATVLHPHQLAGVKAVKAARRAKFPGFLLADDVGLGKTHTTVSAVDALGKGLKVLVLCPLSVVAHWRRVIDATGNGTNRWCVTNYDKAKALLEAPASAATAKRTRTKNKRHATAGRSRVAWDVVVCDEAHLLRNPVSQRSASVRQLISTAPSGKRSTPAFTLWLSATAGQNPLELSYLAPLLSARTGAAVTDLSAFDDWCAQQGIAVRRGAYGAWAWERNEADLALMHDLLFVGTPAPGLRRRPTDLAGWPEQQRLAHAVELDAGARNLYETAWAEFCAVRDAAANTPAKKRRSSEENPLVALLRFRQKASLLRVDLSAELIADLVDNNRQVAVSVQFLATADALAQALAARRIDSVRIAGEDPAAAREEHRLRFQRGEVPVVIFTVTEGISLHAGEVAAEASNTPRVLVVHDARWSAIATAQVEGRVHRDGQNALAYHCFASDTVEEKVVATTLSRLADMKTMVGDDLTGLDLLDALG
jgi:SNF2 family DNA or RNA helicase